ncbi:MAG: nuclear transport factor 2 family protein, partial [Bacteroidota bacterium]|nr:nuclear transport factor 2 family protein [Bacteroidota bacterium]
MKMKTQLTALFAMVALFLASCNTAPKAPEALNLDSVRVEIQKLEDAYAAAEKTKDVDGIVAYYSDDAISYNRNEEPTSGKEAIKKRIAANIAKDTTGNSSVYAIVDLFAAGNQAVEIGSWKSLDP